MGKEFEASIEEEDIHDESTPIDNWDRLLLDQVTQQQNINY